MIRRTVFFLSEDIPWAIERLVALSPGDKKRRAWWVLVIRSEIDLGNRSHLETTFAWPGDQDVALISQQLVVRHRTVDDALAEVASVRAEQHTARAENVRRRQEREDERTAQLAAAAIGALTTRLEAALDRESAVEAKWLLVWQQLMSEDNGHFEWFFTKQTIDGIESLSTSPTAERVTLAATEYLSSA